ncbi:MAG: transglutaminase family protein [Myxococcota bacterium]
MSDQWSGRRTWLVVRHETRIDYGRPVVEAHTELRKTPVDTALQRVITTKTVVAPEVRVVEHLDYFGNRVQHFDILEPHERLSVAVESVVETRDAVACGDELVPDRRSTLDRFAEFSAWSPGVPELDEYGSIPARVSLDAGSDAFLDGLLALGSEFRRRFRYDPDVTHVHSSPAEVFAESGGVCQDFAHAAIGVLRRAGVPARYASGYLYDPSHDDPSAEHLRGSAASHAWIQAWHPELGWVGMDPTNDRLVDWQYVRTAVGRDYFDVQPLRGIFVGEADQQLSVSVHVRRLDGDQTAAA